MFKVKAESHGSKLDSVASLIKHIDANVKGQIFSVQHRNNRASKNDNSRDWANRKPIRSLVVNTPLLSWIDRLNDSRLVLK